MGYHMTQEEVLEYAAQGKKWEKKNEGFKGWGISSHVGIVAQRGTMECYLDNDIVYVREFTDARLRADWMKWCMDMTKNIKGKRPVYFVWKPEERDLDQRKKRQQRIRELSEV